MIICGTGHRPDKLGGYTNEVFSKGVCIAIRGLVNALAESPTPIERVISGGALGWDQMLAQAAVEIKLPLELALPFPGFEDRWPQQSKAYLHSLMHLADKVTFVKDGPYAGWKMQARNEYMVDHSDLVLALWNGTMGGTANCITYAEKKQKPIVNLWDQYDS
jgi:uncharacterized phage-like protein YoqJ